MTVHASVELVEAMRGNFLCVDEEETVGPHALAQCGNPDVKWGCAVWGWCGDRGDGRARFVVRTNATPKKNIAEACDVSRIDCPPCLRLMREATDPVRYDFLRERGLVPELPLVNG